MTDDEDNVIAVDFTAGDRPTTTLLPVRRERSSFGTRLTMAGRVIQCGHPRLEIDEQTLDLDCVDCKERIDPRLFVLEWARRERSVQWTREEVARLHKEVDELRAEERRIKARIRRAKEKL
jgi:hypothetical protein